MKIIINTDTNHFENLSKEFSDLSLERGFVISNGIDVDIDTLENHESFYLKVIQTLRTFFPNSKPIFQKQDILSQSPHEDLKFISYFQPFLSYIQKTQHFNHLLIQIQPNTHFTQEYRENYFLKTKFKKIAASVLHGQFKKAKKIFQENRIFVDDLEQSILDSLDSQRASIRSQMKTMFLGTQSLYFLSKKYKNLSEQDALGFIYFHELGHNLSYEFAQNDFIVPSKAKKEITTEFIFSDVYKQFIQKLDIFSHPNILEKYNDLIEQSNIEEPFTILHPIFFQTLSSLKEESFADISSCLFMRNFLISQNNSSIPDFQEHLKKQIKTIIQFRKDEMEQAYLSSNTEEQELAFFHSLNHFTPQALHRILDILDFLPNKELDIHEITQLSRAYSNQAFLETIYMCYRSSREFQKTLQTLLTVSFDSEQQSLQKISDENFQKFIVFLQDQSNSDWLNFYHHSLQTKDSTTLSSFELFTSSFNQPSIEPSNKLSNQSSFTVPNIEEILSRKEKQFHQIKSTSHHLKIL
jgi:hypothetical protein